MPKIMKSALSTIALELVCVEDKFLHLKATCACRDDFKQETDVPIIVDLAKHYEVDKVVLVGGCVNGTYDFVKKVKASAAQQGITLAWIDYQYVVRLEYPWPHLTGKEAINTYLFGGIGSQLNFDLYATNWIEYQRAEILLPQLVSQAERVRDVLKYIETEKKLLEKYPIVRKVKSMRLGKNPPHSKKLEFEESSVIAFDSSMHLSGALISPGVTTLVQIEPDEYYSTRLNSRVQDGLILGFSDPLKVRWMEGGMDYSIITERGVWYIEPHPGPDPRDPELKFTPLAQRLRKHPMQKHRGHPNCARKHCYGCSLPMSKWKDQPVCLALSSKLKEGYWSGPDKQT
jgi:hypothetical protein